MTLSITIDWLSVTFKEMSHDAKLWLDTLASPKTAISIKPLYGYRTGFESVGGVRFFWNDNRPEMGHHYEFGGTALRFLWEHVELDQKTFVQTVLHFGGRVTRLDLAKDLAETSIDYDNIYEEINEGNHIGTARMPSQRKSPNGGNTVYIGSWKSDKFFRLYNKAAESKLAGADWSRFELVMKSDYARALAWNLANNDDWSAVFDGVALPTCNLPNNADYQLFFPVGNVPIGLPKIEKRSNREKWIDEQVTPAVLQHFVDNIDSAAIAKLRALLDLIESKRENDDADWRDYHDNLQ